MTQPVAQEIKKPVQTLWDASKGLFYRAAGRISGGMGLLTYDAFMSGGFHLSWELAIGAGLAFWGVRNLLKAHYAAEEADCLESHEEAAEKGIEIKGDWDKAKFFMIAGSAACVAGEALIAWCFGCHQLPEPELFFAVGGLGAIGVGGMMLSVGIDALKGKDGKPQEKVAQAPTQEPSVEGPQDTAGPATPPPVPAQPAALPLLPKQLPYERGAKKLLRLGK